MVVKKLPLFDAVNPKEELKQAPSGAPAKGAFINPMGFFRAQKNEEKKAIDSKPNFVVEVLDAKRDESPKEAKAGNIKDQASPK
jgi:hypothetical protein